MKEQLRKVAEQYAKEYALIDEVPTPQYLEEIFIAGAKWMQRQMPQWRQIESAYEYPDCLTKEMDENGDYHYCISRGKIWDGCEYILLAELELKLKREED